MVDDTSGGTAFRFFAPPVSLLQRVPAYGFLAGPVTVGLAWAGSSWYSVAFGACVAATVIELLIQQDRRRQYSGILTNVDIRIDWRATRPVHMRFGGRDIGTPEAFIVDYVDIISASFDGDRVSIAYGRSDDMERKELVLRVVDAGRMYGDLEARVRESLDATDAITASAPRTTV